MKTLGLCDLLCCGRVLRNKWDECELREESDEREENDN
jgi:hypothetical protein